MPELPEVETTLRGIEPHISGSVIEQLRVYNGSLRWPVTEGISEIVKGQRLRSLTRRAKYLLLHLEQGSMMVHLGMSGSLRLVDPDSERRKHDHIEMHMRMENACDTTTRGALVLGSGLQTATLSSIISGLNR